MILTLARRDFGEAMSPRVGLNILVVDDDPRCLGTLEDFLEGEGHKTATALRGEEAISIARERSNRNLPFELSILDLHVPDMDGLETYGHLTGLLPGLGAIFISGDLSAANAHSIYEAGGFRAMGKPVDIAEMRKAIEDYRRLLASGEWRPGRVAERQRVARRETPRRRRGWREGD